MKVVFHEDYLNVHTLDPAAARSERLEELVDLIKNDSFYEIVEAKPASKEDILRAHTERHFHSVKSDPLAFNFALLAAGGAVQAAEIAYNEKTASFGFIRPPGYRTGRDYCGEYCYFNNIAVSLLYLMDKYALHSVFVLDFDLHSGEPDESDIFSDADYPGIQILNPYHTSEKNYMNEVKETLDSLSDVDIILASSGFNDSVQDWGKPLSAESYNQIGKWLKEYSLKLCDGRRYTILEENYDFRFLPTIFDSFCKGFGD
jgi:hypothetical protein